MMEAINIDQLLTIIGAGGGGAYMAVKVALKQVLNSIERAQQTADAAHTRIDNHLEKST